MRFSLAAKARASLSCSLPSMVGCSAAGQPTTGDEAWRSPSSPTARVSSGQAQGISMFTASTESLFPLFWNTPHPLRFHVRGGGLMRPGCRLLFFQVCRKKGTATLVTAAARWCWSSQQWNDTFSVGLSHAHAPAPTEGCPDRDPALRHLGVVQHKMPVDDPILPRA
jgi:hypothetical protein